MRPHPPHSAHTPWPIRVVIVAPFQPAPHLGTVGSEAASWIANERLTETLDFPAGPHPLRTNAERTMLLLISGTTLANAAASLLALGLDARFDLTRAYWLINGIAGVDPAVASIGSAAWASFVVGDVARELDARETPDDWPYGAFPVGSRAPNPATLSEVPWARSNLFSLNPALAHWAFTLTRNLVLPDDDPAIHLLRAAFHDTPAAQARPFVLQGDVFSSNRFWHGRTLTRFAEDWVRLHTAGRGRFAMSAMEDAGFLTAAERLAAAGLLDSRRILLLRAASNYTAPPPGQAASQTVNAPLLGTRLALQSAWLTGGPVVRLLVDQWDTTADLIPADNTSTG